MKKKFKKPFKPPMWNDQGGVNVDGRWSRHGPSLQNTDGVGKVKIPSRKEKGVNNTLGFWS